MLGAAHSMANPLTARFGLPHGQAVGTVLPYVVAFNAENERPRSAYAELARVAGLSGQQAVGALVELLTGFVATAGLPTSLKPSGVRRGDIAALAAEAARQWTASFNPRPVDVHAFERLFSAAAA
jgi:alcohol dehydrogenase